ncbi:hypothetical protein RGE_33080 [Rubrivivax gelatinosus IL144]|uniref:Uncharacterized protein n=1 Tax=Rubrivivax gelatinosus (strain NBRC 100245 / IL144) TaxID=983917 RepID=I0HUG0_RUBGI|nr:hypothetical protein RGE_33080 [Rubrivivax gelatinosus IL144]
MAHRSGTRRSLRGGYGVGHGPDWKPAGHMPKPRSGVVFGCSSRARRYRGDSRSPISRTGPLCKNPPDAFAYPSRFTDPSCARP